MEAVEVMQTRNPLNDADFMQLQQTVDPTQNSYNYGIDIYLATLNFCRTKKFNFDSYTLN